LTLLLALVAPGGIGQNFQESKYRTWSIAFCTGGYGYLLLCWNLRIVFEGEVGIGYTRAINSSSRVVNNSVVNLGATVIEGTYLKHPYWIATFATAGGGSLGDPTSAAKNITSI
jgi:hypothetical protein